MPINRLKTKKQKFALALAITVLVFLVFSFCPACKAENGPKSTMAKVFLAQTAKAQDFNEEGGWKEEGEPEPGYPTDNQGGEGENDTTVANSAASPADEKLTFVAGIFSSVGTIIVSLEGFIIRKETEVLMLLMSYNDFVVSSAVNIGWTLLRDVANLFFVLILLAIAIGTILHIESYNFKRLLPKVILMAVLINFSRLICGLLIDFAQVVMMTFAAAFAGTAGAGRLYSVLNILEMLNNVSYKGKEEIGAWQVAATYLLAVIMLLIAIIVILVIMVVILMRIVMLWLLVVLSPLAYIMAAFPGGQRYAQQWWQEFAKYVIIGPVLAFFLWLTFAIVTSSGKIDSKEMGLPQTIPEKEGYTERIFIGITDTPAMLQFIIAIGMLLGGLMITQQMAVAGSGFAGNMYNKIRGAGVKPFTKLGQLGRWGLGEAGGLISRRAARISKKGGFYRLAALASPRTLKEGFAAAKQRAEREAYPEAAAGIHDVINRYNPFVRKKTHYQRMARRTDVRQQSSEIEAANLSEIELAMELEEELNSRHPEMTRVEALLREQKNNKQEDDWLVTYLKGNYGPNEEADIYDRIKNIFGEEEALNIFGSLTDYGEGLAKTRGFGNVTQSYNQATGKIEKKFNRSASDYAAEAQTRLNRGELQRLLSGLEGKAFRKLVYGDKEGPNAGKGVQVIDALTNTKVFSNMTDFESRGAAMFRVFPKKLSDIITRRGHNMAGRVKETIGFNEGKDAKGRPTGDVWLSSAGALIDSFRLNPELAASTLGNLKLTDEQFSFTYKLLTSEAAKEAGVDDYGGLKIIAELFSKGLLKGKDAVPISKEQTEFLERLKTGTYKFERIRDKAVMTDEDKVYRPTTLVETKPSAVSGQAPAPKEAPETPPPAPATEVAQGATKPKSLKAKKPSKSTPNTRSNFNTIERQSEPAQREKAAAAAIRRVPAEELVVAGQEKVEERSEAIDKAFKKEGGFDSNRIVQELGEIKDTLAAIATLLDKMPAATPEEKTSLADLMTQFGQMQTSHNAGRIQLAPDSTNALLYKINENLKKLYRKEGEATGEMPKNLPPGTEGIK